MALGKVNALALREFNSQFTTAKKVKKRSFFPNPGSQARLFFDYLGCEKGESKIIEYPDGEKLTAYGVIPKVYKGKPNFIYLRAGNGAGKSLSGAGFLHAQSILHSDKRGLISANDYTQLKDSTLIAIIKYCWSHGVEISPSKATAEQTAASAVSPAVRGLYIEKTYHFVRTAKDFVGETEKATQTGRGLEIAWCLLDEWARLPNATAFNALLTRLRWPKMRPVGLMTSTINTDVPYNWAWRVFDDENRSQEEKELFVSLTGSSWENRHNLAEGFLEMLKARLTPALYQIEVLGQYAQVKEGKILDEFDRDRHLFPCEYNRRHEIHLSFDFNTNPAVALAAQFINGKVYVVKTWYIVQGKTFGSVQAVVEWLKDNRYPTNFTLQIHGDASGSNETANASETNWEIVHDRLRRYDYSINICYGAANPNIQDTFNSTNIALRNDEVVINPDEVELVKDIESATHPYDDFKKKNKERSHLLDSFRYLVHDLIPYSGAANFLSSSVTW